MFLSRVEIPWQSARNPYEMHRQLWKLFPGEVKETRSSNEETRQGFLFSIEDAPTGRPSRLIVQSHTRPHSSDGLMLHGIKEFNPQPAAKQRLGFVLTANPVKTILDTQREAKPGKQSEKCRVPLIKEEERHAWIERKLSTAVEIELVSILPHAPIYFRKGNRGGKIVTVTFEGIMKVVDSVKLIKLLKNGVGPAKAFGCGLLLVRRV